MGFFDSIFGSQRKEEGFEAIPLTETQKIADAKRKELLQKTEVFQPRQIAGLTKAEQMAVNEVTKMMQKGIPGVSEAMSAVRGFMSPDLSPMKIPGLSGLFQKVQELGSSLMGKTKRGLALMGNIPSASSAGTKVLGRTFQDILDRFTTAAYPFYQQALSNMYSAPERLANLGTGDISTRTGLATSVGAAPRTIQQQINDAILEAKRKTQGFPYDVTFPMSSDIMGEQRYAYDPGVTSPSIFSQIGQVAGPIAGAAIMASDERLKENIKPIDNALAKIKKLEGKTYNFKTLTTKDAGVIAQDLEKVLPEAVIEKDGIKYVKYEAVIALLVNAVKELAKKVA